VVSALCPKQANELEHDAVRAWVKRATDPAVRSAWEAGEEEKRVALAREITRSVFKKPDGSQRSPTESEILTFFPHLAPKPFHYDFDLVRVSLKDLLDIEQGPPYPHDDLTYLRSNIDPMVRAVWEAAELVYDNGKSKINAARVVGEKYNLKSESIRDNLKPRGLNKKIRAVLPQYLIDYLEVGENR
jgi:hypothetical protein